LYFYRNHPIKYVRLSGVVVCFFEYPQRWVFVLDDSSGSTIEFIATRPQDPNNEISISIHGGEERIAENGADVSGIDVGSIVKVKGLIGEWWGKRQILLERIAIVRDTNEEVRIWQENTKYLVEVLSKPWHVSPEDQKRLLAEAEDDKGKDLVNEEKKRERGRRMQMREERHRAQIQKQWEREETERGKVGNACREESRELYGTSTAETFRRRRHDLKVTILNARGMGQAEGCEKQPKLLKRQHRVIRLSNTKS
jgi:hypothetical protein